MGCPTACVQTCLMQHGVERISCGSNTTLFTFCIRLGNYLKKKIITTKKNARSPEQFKGPKKIKKKKIKKRFALKELNFDNVKLLLPCVCTASFTCPSQPRAQPSRWQLSTEQTLHLTKTFQIFLIWGGFLQRKIKITLQTSLQNQDHMKTAVLKQGGLLPFCFANRTNPASLFFITGSSCHGKQGLCPFPKWMNELSAKLYLC